MHGSRFLDTSFKDRITRRVTRSLQLKITTTFQAKTKKPLGTGLLRKGAILGAYKSGLGQMKLRRRRRNAGDDDEQVVEAVREGHEEGDVCVPLNGHVAGHEEVQDHETCCSYLGYDEGAVAVSVIR